MQLLWRNLHLISAVSRSSERHLCSSVSKFTTVRSPAVVRNGKLEAVQSAEMNAEFSVRPVGSIQTYYLNCWSVSGMESCVSVRIEQHKYAFDIGHTTRTSLNCDNVFITHGHVDHCGALAKHISQRDMRSQKPATYYCPPDILDPLRNICRSYAEMSDHKKNDMMNPKLVAVPVGQTVELRGNRTMTPFRTYHRVPSQGFLISCKERTLLQEFAHLSPPEIGEYVAAGYTVHETSQVPEIAYTGDTTIDAFLDPANADILRSKILITEATYICSQQSPSKAKERGHMHLRDIASNAELFRETGALILVHMSDRYSCAQAAQWVQRSLPAWLLQKTWVPTLMKEIS